MIKESLSSVGSTLVLGVILSMIVLFIFFGDWKASIIVGCSMPISLLMTVIVMSMMGFSLNIMTLGGLVIAIGMMVDSSSVVIESCFRANDRVPDFSEAALQGTTEVVASIVASTITTVVVYLPLCFSGGMTGQIFMQLGLTIVFSMVASLISAITLVPLFFKLYKPTQKKELRLTRVFAVILPLGALVIALYIKNAYSILMFAWSFYAAAAGLPAFAALYWKKATKAGIIAGMVAGFTVCVGWKLAGVPFGLGPTVPGAIACAAALVGVSLATYRKAPTPFLDPDQNAAGR